MVENNPCKDIEMFYLSFGGSLKGPMGKEWAEYRKKALEEMGYSVEIIGDDDLKDMDQI